MRGLPATARACAWALAAWDLVSLADSLDDLHAFDPATMTWTLLSAANDAPRPSARHSHGFTSAGGRLYVHGGQDSLGGRGGWRERGERERERERERLGEAGADGGGWGVWGAEGVRV
jgi:hypothetical protein